MHEEFLLMIAVPAFVVLVLVELYFLNFRSSGKESTLVGYAWGDTWASLSMGLGYLVINTVWKLPLLVIYYWFYQYRLFDIEMTPLLWVVLMVGQDFCYYWYHRTHHGVRVLWAAHVNHHSSEHYNLSTALRQSWSATFFAAWFFLPLVLLGFDPKIVLVAELLSLIYQYWIHTETIESMGVFEYVFNTPSHHRVHHGTNPEYLDKNHAGILIVWDRLFGTFQKEEARVIYGITNNIDTFNPVKIAFHEWAAIFRDVARSTTWAERFGYVFMPPGWQPKNEQCDGGSVVMDGASA